MKIADIMEKLARDEKKKKQEKGNCQIIFCCLVVLAAFFNFALYHVSPRKCKNRGIMKTFLSHEFRLVQVS